MNLSLHSTLRAVIVTSLLTLPAGTAHGQASAGTDGALTALRDQIVPGQVAVDLTAAADPGQRYAVYLPSSYDEQGTWPVLFLMDPRGRALIPLNLFVEAAERRGWILVSSYNTASDIAEDVNTPAMQAMLRDSSQLFRLDPQRAYLTGFSGTARSAWSFARALGGTVAGVIGFGGGLPQGERGPTDGSFAFYGAAGFTDFNYLEMGQLDQALDGTNILHRFEYFPGPHAWGSAEVCGRAVDWMELQAMRTGRRPVDPEIIEEILVARTAEARAWDAAAAADAADDSTVITRRGPRPFEAQQRYAAIAEDFAGLASEQQLAEATQRAAELAATDEVRDRTELDAKLEAEEAEARGRFRSVLGQMHRGKKWDLASVARELEVQQMHASAADTSSPARALAAQRVIAALFTQCVFYQPQGAMQAGEFRRALHFLELADELQPGTARVPRMMANAHAQLGDAARAVEQLRRAHAIAPLTAEQLRRDPGLAPIRDTREFQEFVGQL